MSDFLNPAVQEWIESAILREAFLAGEAGVLPLLRPDVQQGWERSQAAGVDPALKQVPLLLEGRPLHEYRSGHEAYRAGLPALEAAAALLVGTGCGVILADAQGMVLYAGGDSAMMTAAERVGSLPGSSWREDLVGNNAVGTSLVTCSLVQFRAYEHWCAGWDQWICAAAPVLDRRAGIPLASVALVASRETQVERMLSMADRLAGSVEKQVESLCREQENQLRLEAVRLQRWFPGHGVVAVNQRGAAIWSGGKVPPGLRTLLRSERPAWPLSGVRGEREVLLGGAYPCLVIPIWNGTEPCGYVLVVSGEDGRHTSAEADGHGPSLQPAATRPNQQVQPTDPAQPAQRPRQASAASPSPVGRRQIVAVAEGRRILFSPDQVLALRTIGGRIHVMTESGQWPTPYKGLGEAAKHLPTHRFFQTDRGTLVNLDRVREIHPMFNRTVTLVMADRNRTEFPVSRRQTAALRELLPF